MHGNIKVFFKRLGVFMASVALGTIVEYLINTYKPDTPIWLKFVFVFASALAVNLVYAGLTPNDKTQNNKEVKE